MWYLSYKMPLMSLAVNLVKLRVKRDIKIQN